MSLDFVPSRHYQPLDDDADAVADLDVEDNLALVNGSDALQAEPIPRALARTVSFNSLPVERTAQVLSDETNESTSESQGEQTDESGHQTSDDSSLALTSVATYSECQDDGELARAARAIALKTRRTHDLFGTSPASATSDPMDVNIDASGELHPAGDGSGRGHRSQGDAQEQEPAESRAVTAQLKEMQERLARLESLLEASTKLSLQLSEASQQSTVSAEASSLSPSCSPPALTTTTTLPAASKTPSQNGAIPHRGSEHLTSSKGTLRAGLPSSAARRSTSSSSSGLDAVHEVASIDAESSPSSGSSGSASPSPCSFLSLDIFTPPTEINLTSSQSLPTHSPGESTESTEEEDRGSSPRSQVHANDNPSTSTAPMAPKSSSKKNLDTPRTISAVSEEHYPNSFGFGNLKPPLSPPALVTSLIPEPSHNQPTGGQVVAQPDVAAALVGATTAKGAQDGPKSQSSLPVPPGSTTAHSPRKHCSSSSSASSSSSLVSACLPDLSGCSSPRSPNNRRGARSKFNRMRSHSGDIPTTSALRKGKFRSLTPPLPPSSSASSPGSSSSASARWHHDWGHPHRELTLSPRLMKGMDYSGRAWDDGGMLWRDSAAIHRQRAGLLDHPHHHHHHHNYPHRNGGEGGGSSRKSSRSDSVDLHGGKGGGGGGGGGSRGGGKSGSGGGDLPAAKKSHIAGPGLAVYDKVADSSRAEDQEAIVRRWVRAPALKAKRSKSSPSSSSWWWFSRGTRGASQGEGGQRNKGGEGDDEGNSEHVEDNDDELGGFRVGFGEFLGSDLLAASTPPEIEEAIQRGVTNFLKVPLSFERFVVFGVFTSLDMFLYVLTFLPLRSALTACRWALFLFVLSPLSLALHLSLMPGSLPRQVAWSLLAAVIRPEEGKKKKKQQEIEEERRLLNERGGKEEDEAKASSGTGGESAAGEERGGGDHDDTLAPNPPPSAPLPSSPRTAPGPNGDSGSSSSSSSLLALLWQPPPPFSFLRPTFHRSHGYDLLRVCLFLGAWGALQLLDMSRVYHYIRGQAMIKLYVIISMVEIFDRLISSFGQDVLDSLYWTVRCDPRSTRLLLEVPVALVYIGVHSCLFFVNVATLNVAINSADGALLSLLISGNFAEIKTSVFKKFDANNLFQVASSDVTERFKLFVFMILVLLLNLVQNADNDKKVLWTFLQQTSLVFSCEVIADWIKHAFITKFNGHEATLYKRFTLVLVQDVTEARHDFRSRPVLDRTHSLARRIGLAQLPLACIATRFMQDVWARVARRFEVSGRDQAKLLLRAFAALFLLKVLTGIVLAGACAEFRIAEETRKATAKSATPSSGSSKEARASKIASSHGVANKTTRSGSLSKAENP